MGRHHLLEAQCQAPHTRVFVCPLLYCAMRTGDDSSTELLQWCGIHKTGQPMPVASVDISASLLQRNSYCFCPLRLGRGARSVR